MTLTFDHDIRTRARFLHNAPNRQVSSSYVSSFGSYRVDKQTHKQTFATENIHFAPLVDKYLVSHKITTIPYAYQQPLYLELQ